MVASVNSLFPDQNRPSHYIIKKEIYRHPLVNRTMFKKIINGGKLRKSSASVLYWLLVQSREQKEKSDIIVSNNYFVETADYSYRTITRCFSDLQDSGYILKRSVIKSDGKICRTTNHFEICWLALYKDFGEALFTDFMENMVKFIKGRIARAKEILATLCRPFCPTDKLSSKEDIYNNIYRNLEKNEELMEQEVLLKGEYEKTPLDELLSENEADQRSYFNPEIRICPLEWTQIATTEGMAPEYIDDEFIEFRDYWIGQGKIKHAKKASWTRTWRNRIRDVINNYRTSYKSIQKQAQQEQWKQKLQENGKGFSLLENHSVPNTNLSEDRIAWNNELTNESFWKISGNPDNSSFNAFYTGKGAHIMDTKSGWLQRCVKWHDRTRLEQSPAVKAYGEAKTIEVKLPDHLSEIHRRLMNRMQEHNYISWVQSPKIIIQEHANPSNLYSYSANYPNAFMKKVVLERYRDDFEDLKIEII